MDSLLDFLSFSNLIFTYCVRNRQEIKFKNQVQKSILCNRYLRKTITDIGYRNCGAGWFDVPNQGVCNDYCRWVGNCGCRSGCSWWSCALAGSDNTYTKKGEYQGLVLLMSICNLLLFMTPLTTVQEALALTKSCLSVDVQRILDL